MAASRPQRSLLSDVDILVLAGGLGTRLGGVLADLPKIMAPIGGRPFLEHLLQWLIEQGAARVVLGLGYRANAVIEYLERHPFGPLEVLTVTEPRPLGTAGAVGFAMSVLQSNPVLVMNGDTFVEADLASFVASHLNRKAAASVLCARVEDPQRYGRVQIDSSDRILLFEEKNATRSAPSWVNAGVYLFDRSILTALAKLSCGSLERDVLETMLPGSIHAYRSAGRFLDIGTPESLAQAGTFFQHRLECSKS